MGILGRENKKRKKNQEQNKIQRNNSIKFPHN